MLIAFSIFIAELGDKTQITTMLLSAESNSKLSVFIGSAFALVCSSLFGVLLGSLINKYIPPNVIQTAAAAAFIIIGILLLFNKI
jgi:putative Ca2+/H+ antiporter (TMEM165/GDT1 family)